MLSINLPQAGILNAVSLYSILETSVSHVSGNMTLLAIALNFPSTENEVKAVHLAINVSCFLIGGIITGAIHGSGTFNLQRNYGLVMLFESVLITIAYFMAVSRFC